jgi:endoglucanase
MRFFASFRTTPPSFFLALVLTTTALANPTPVPNLIGNGNFEEAEGAGSKAWDDRKDGISRESEANNAFSRLTVVEPGKMVTLFREIPLPAGTKALELKWRWRITGLEKGERKENDARIILAFRDAQGKTLPDRPNAPYFNRKDSSGWAEGSARFIVPRGATSLELMPALFNARAGTMDIDDISLKPADIRLVMAEIKSPVMPPDPAPENPQPEKWPSPLRVEGNKLVNAAGSEVWLQGINIPGLEWNPKGESALYRMLTAITDWKANVIRLPIKSELWNGPDSAAYRKLVDAAITLAANRGVYVVVDLHSYRAIKPEHVEFWKDFATQYRDHPALLFDILNEPHGISWDVWRNGGFVEERNQKADEDAFLGEEERLKARQGFQSPGMQAAVDAIRQTGAKNVLVAGALDYAYDLSGILNGYALEDKGGHGIMYSTHVYPWKSDWQGKFLAVAERHPILVGEVGADEKKMEFIPIERQEDPATWVPDMLATIQRHKLNWTGWSFHPFAGPRLVLDWKMTPTPTWGEMAKRALAGERFESTNTR